MRTQREPRGSFVVLLVVAKLLYVTVGQFVMLPVLVNMAVCGLLMGGQGADRHVFCFWGTCSMAVGGAGCARGRSNYSMDYDISRWMRLRILSGL